LLPKIALGQGLTCPKLNPFVPVALQKPITINKMPAAAPEFMLPLFLSIFSFFGAGGFKTYKIKRIICFGFCLYQNTNGRLDRCAGPAKRRAGAGVNVRRHRISSKRFIRL
jgi:hypothetical protein